GTDSRSLPQKSVPANRASVDRKEQKRIEAQQRQARSGERKAEQQRVHQLEKEIEQLETQIRDLTAELENPATYDKPGRPAELNREISHAQERLAELTPAWEAAAEKLATMV